MTTTRDEVARLARAGFTDVEIAARLDRSPYQIGVVRRSQGIPRARNRNPVNKPSAELIAQMRERAAEGWPPGEIATTLGVGIDSVRRWCDAVQNGRDWNKVARWASRHHHKLYEELAA